MRFFENATCDSDISFIMQVNVIIALMVAILTAVVDGQSASCWPSGLVKQSDMPFCRLMDQNYALHWSIKQMTLTVGIYVLGANKASYQSSPA